jgi:hypothetical protein
MIRTIKGTQGVNAMAVEETQTTHKGAGVIPTLKATTKKGAVYVRQVNPKTVSTEINERIQWLVLWIALNLAPIVGLLALLALALLGCMEMLGTHLQHEQRLLVSIVIVGCFATLALTVRKTNK